MSPGSPGTFEPWLVAFLGDRWAGENPATATFAELGLDSFGLVAMCRAAEDWLGRPVPPAWAFRYPTPARLAAAVEAPRSAAGGLDPVSVVGSNEPIAIVGMAVRAPGGVVDPDGLWRVLREGVDTIGPVPPQRWDVEAVARVDERVPRLGGFIDDVETFDPAFFRISAREAEQMDPLQFMALELAWEGLEHAGIVASRLRGTDVGVFMGAVQSDFAALVHERAATRHTSTGSHISLVSNRISYALGLTGPSMVIDSACSSSLVAVHLACRAIRTGDCGTAIAGGVHLQLSPFGSLCLTRLGGLSPRGRCRTFDAGADGFARGEGGGVVVLKSLAQAQADGDVVHGLVVGSAVNNDGGGNGLTAPNPRAQASLVRRALRSAGCTASQVGYLEAHGTGTPLGDAIEVEALGDVFGGRETPVPIGSAKTNFGHLEGAAGILGLLKATLSCERGRFVPTLHVEHENPQIDMNVAGLQPCTEDAPWTAAPELRIAGVSSFGFGGTNAHVVVRGAAAETVVSEATRERSLRPDETGAQGAVFVYAGVGHQRVHMGRELAGCRPGFREALQEMDPYLEPHLGASVFEFLRTTDDTWTREPFLYHPLLFALQVGLTRVLAHSGIVPAAVIGHSMGEYAAAVAAGALSLADGCAAVCAHARAVRGLGSTGAMAVVGAGPDECAALIADVGLGDSVEVAGENGPASTVVSGTATAVQRVLERATARELWAAPANVGYAAHSRAIEEVRDEFVRGMQGLRPRPGHTPMFSATAVKWVRGSQVDGGYWFANLRGRVRFQESLRALVAAGHGRFIELSPHPSLVSERNTAALQGAFVPSLRRGESEDRCLRAVLRSVERPAAEATRIEPVTCISARSWPAVRAMARRLARWWERRDQVDASDLAVNATTGRQHFDHRVAVVGADRDLVLTTLRQVADEGPAAHPLAGKAPRSAPEVCFMFPGQGGPWRGLSAALLGRAVVRRTIDACAEAFAELRVDFEGSTLRDRLARAAERVPVDQRQPMNFAVSVAVAELMRAEGIEPTRVVGHSQGEVAAAVFAGTLSLRDGAAVVAERSRGLRTLSGTGAMALVELHPDEVGEEPLAVLGLAGVPGCVVAARNSPLAVVIAGRPAVVSELGAACEAGGRFFRALDVEVASHSDSVRELVPSLRTALADIVAHEPTIPWMSSVDAEFMMERPADAEYWCRNLCEPVSFSDAIAELESRGSCVFVEASAHPILSPSVERGLLHRDASSTVAPGLRRDVSVAQSLAELRARLFCEGVEVKWGPVFPEGGTRLSLPSYPWQRRRFPLPRRRSPALEGSEPSRADAEAGSLEFEVERGRRASIDDHIVAGEVVVPAAVHCSWLVAAWERAWGSSSQGICVGDLVVPEALRVHENARHRVRASVAFDGGAAGAARIVTVADDGTVLAEHARARVWSASADQLDALPPMLGSPEPSIIEGATFYRELAARGHEYGPSLSRVEVLRVQGEGCRVRLRPLGLDEAERDGEGTVMSIVLDAALQAAVYMMPGETTVVAAGIERVVWRREPRPRQPLDVRLVFDRADLVAAMEACDSDGMFAQVRGLRLVAVGSASSEALRAPLERRWVEWTGAGHGSPPRHRCLVIGREDGLATPLREALERRGAMAERIDIGSSVIEAPPATPSPSEPELVVVDVRPFDAASHRAPAERSRWAPLTDGLELTAGLARTTGGVRLLFVTAGGVGPRGASVQGSVLGFARAAAYEHPELGCGRVELRGTPSSADLDRLADVVLDRNAPRECSLESGQVRVPRLRPLAGPAAPGVVLAADATYVVTGGHGVLGLEAARWLAGCGARRLVLLSRRGARPSVQGELDGLREHGVEVVSVAVDLCDAAAVREGLASAQWARAPVRGIIHAAGVLGDRFVLDLDAPTLLEPLGPKVLAVEHIVAAISTRLDFLVLYSSAAGWLGLPGQAGYCAANGALDAQARALREAGHPAVSVAWGSFGRGLAAGADRGERLEAQGLGRLTTARHEQLLAVAVTTDSASIGAFDLDAPRWLEAHPQLSPQDLGLLPQHSKVPSPPGEPPADITRVVFEVICEVLRCRRGDLDVEAPFSELGLDSMGALELRNRLEKRIGRPVAVTLIWSHPSSAALAAALEELVAAARDRKVGEPTSASASPPSGDDAALARFLDSFEERRRSRP